MIGRKFNSIKKVEAGDEVAVQLVVAGDVVGLAGVDSKRSGSPERALQLKYIMNKRDGLNSWKTLKSLLDSGRQLLCSEEGLILLNDS